MLKKELRPLMKDMRNRLSADEVSENSKKICAQIKKLYPNRHLTVCAYASIRNEVDISEIFTYYENVFLPVTEGEILTFYRMTDDLKIGTFGVPEPEKTVVLDVTPDIVLVPGVAYDENLNRVGYGKGYYDRFLECGCADIVGVAHDFQVVKEIEDVLETDIRMKKIITERRVIDGTE